jgi:hypothetical protein
MGEVQIVFRCKDCGTEWTPKDQWEEGPEVEEPPAMVAFKEKCPVCLDKQYEEYGPITVDMVTDALVRARGGQQDMGDSQQAAFVIGVLTWVHSYEAEAKRSFPFVPDFGNDKLPMLDPDVIRAKLMAIAERVNSGTQRHLDDVSWVCVDCGLANGTRKPIGATWHFGTCDLCGNSWVSVTEPRDFGL